MGNVYVSPKETITKKVYSNNPVDVCQAIRGWGFRGFIVDLDGRNQAYRECWRAPCDYVRKEANRWFGGGIKRMKTSKRHSVTGRQWWPLAALPSPIPRFFDLWLEKYGAENDTWCRCEMERYPSTDGRMIQIRRFVAFLKHYVEQRCEERALHGNIKKKTAPQGPAKGCTEDYVHVLVASHCQWRSVKDGRLKTLTMTGSLPLSLEKPYTEGKIDLKKLISDYE